MEWRSKKGPIIWSIAIAGALAISTWVVDVLIGALGGKYYLLRLWLLCVTGLLPVTYVLCTIAVLLVRYSTTGGMLCPDCLRTLSAGRGDTASCTGCGFQTCRDDLKAEWDRRWTTRWQRAFRDLVRRSEAAAEHRRNLNRQRMEQKLRQQRCRRERPGVLAGIAARCGIQCTLQDFLPLDESDQVLVRIGQQFAEGVKRKTWPVAEQAAVGALLARLADDEGEGRLVLVQSYADNSGVIQVPAAAGIRSAMALCSLDEESALLTTMDVNHGLNVEHNSHDEDGNEVEQWVIEAWGNFATRLREAEAANST